MTAIGFLPNASGRLEWGAFSPSCSRPHATNKTVQEAARKLPLRYPWFAGYHLDGSRAHPDVRHQLHQPFNTRGGTSEWSPG